MTSGRLKVAIIGGGISGLAAANALIRRGMEVKVYERADALGEVGAGVQITPNALRHLYNMGMEQALKSVGGDVSGRSEYYRMDGSLVAPALTRDSTGEYRTCAIHRADLLSILAEGLPDGVVETGYECVDFAQTEHEGIVRFANGDEIRADAVVAADGIHSVLRAFVTEPTPPVHSGSVAYRGLLARDSLDDWRQNAFQVWMGEGKHFMVFPVRRGAMLNYVAFVPTNEQTAESWSAHGDPVALAAAFEGWDERVVHLLSRVESCFWWGLYDREPLPTWTAGRLTLLGDAAHPMLPHLGQGANQSIEDGVALAVFLEGKDVGSVSEGFAGYENFRRERTAMVQLESRKNGLRYDSRYKDINQRDAEIADSAKLRRSLYDYNVEKEALQAVGRL